MVLPEDSRLAGDLKSCRELAASFQTRAVNAEATLEDVEQKLSSKSSDYKHCYEALVTLKSGLLPPNELRDKCRSLGRELFAFLSEKGPRPEHPIEYMGRFQRENPRHFAIPDEESKIVSDAWFKYDAAVRAGYQRRLSNKVVDFLLELTEHHIEVPNIGPAEKIDSDEIRKIAVRLFETACRLEIKDASSVPKI
jgi:hypothetical protein